MAISAADVKALREKTGAGPMECKNALVESGGDAAAAEKLLKEKGLAAAAKRTGRATNEGRITIKQGDGKVVLVETTTETDFVARNPEFIALGDAIAGIALEKGHEEPNDELHALVKDLATKIRENMALRRVKLVKTGANQYADSYIHGDGAIGVVVVASSDKPEVFLKGELKGFIHDIALHIAAFSPEALAKEDVRAEFIAEQEGIFRKQMEMDEKLAGKPASVLDGILGGKVKKWLAEICLLDQKFVKNDKLTVAAALAEAGKAAGAGVKLDGFVCFRVGG
ncbi:MAG: translation elongation factor Ts [Spirochaetaceae bacterium]|jgi:elongation factor Ts|nr:translation elongation factor Ts [Spirochaetaceae bacterium]